MEFDYVRPQNSVANKIISSFSLDYYLKNMTTNKKLNIIKNYREHIFKESCSNITIMEIGFEDDEETISSFTYYASNGRIDRDYQFRDNKIRSECQNIWDDISENEYHLYKLNTNHIESLYNCESFTVVKNGYELLKVYNDTNPRYNIYINGEILGIGSDYLGLYEYSSYNDNAVIHHKQLFNLVKDELKYVYDILNTKLPFEFSIPIKVGAISPNVSFITSA